MIIHINRQFIQGGFFISLFCVLIRQHTCLTTLRWLLIINSLNLSSCSKHTYSLPLKKEKDSMVSFITCFICVFLTLRDQEGMKAGMVIFLNHCIDNLLHKWPSAIPKKKKKPQSDHKLLVTTFILHG